MLLNISARDRPGIRFQFKQFVVFHALTEIRKPIFLLRARSHMPWLNATLTNKRTHGLKHECPRVCVGIIFLELGGRAFILFLTSFLESRFPNLLSERSFALSLKSHFRRWLLILMVYLPLLLALPWNPSPCAIFRLTQQVQRRTHRSPIEEFRRAESRRLMRN